MSKVFKRVVLNRILQFENVNKLIIPEQFGFRKHRNIVQQLVRLLGHIITNFNINKSTAMLFSVTIMLPLDKSELRHPSLGSS